MQTSIYTQMEISGKTEEIMKAIEVIMDYQCKTHRAKYYFANGIITVNNSRMELQAELISEYLKNTEGTIQGAITIEMDGPYGEFYSLREIGFFEKIADEIPAITLKGSFIEEGTYSYETVEAQLINMRLQVSKYYENFEVIDDNYLKWLEKNFPITNLSNYWDLIQMVLAKMNIMDLYLKQVVEITFFSIIIMSFLISFPYLIFQNLNMMIYLIH